MLRMDGVDHALGVAEAKGIEGECTPRVGAPVVPVHDDIVNRELAVAEALEGIQDLTLRLVALAALPESEEPLGHDLCLAGQGAIALDDLVAVVACNKVVVELLHHLAPEAELGLFLGKDRGQSTQSAIGFATIGNPVETELIALACLHPDSKLARIGVPSGTPDGLVAGGASTLHVLGIDIAAVDVDLLIAAVVMAEVVLAGHTGHNLALIGHMSLVHTVLGQVAGRSKVLEVDAVLSTHKRLLAGGRIGAGESTCHAILVVEVEKLVKLAIVLGVAKAHQRIAIDQHTIVVARHDERHRNLGVVLEELLVLALVVPVIGLMLAKAIECLVGRTIEDHACGPSLPGGGIGHFSWSICIGRPDSQCGTVGRKSLAALSLFGQNNVTLEVGEPDLAVTLENMGHDEGRLDTNSIAVLDDIVLHLLVLGHDDERGTVGKLVGGSSRHTNDLFAHHFETDELRAIGSSLFHTDGDLLTFLADSLAST